MPWSDRVQSDEATVSSVLVEVNGRMDSYMEKKTFILKVPRHLKKKKKGL